jgi:sugar phosphate permease
MTNLKEKIKDGDQSNKGNDFYKWIAYILGSIAHLFNFFHRVTTSVLAPYLVETFKISSTSLGLMSSIYFYSYAALQPVVGILTDRWKPRKTLTVCVFIMTLGTFIFAYSPSFIFTYLGRLLIGIGSAGIFVPVSWMITEYFAYDKRGFIFAILMFIANIGSLLATSPFAKLIAHFSWRNSLANISYISFALAVLIWLVVRDGNSNKIKEVNLNNQDKKSVTKTEEEKSSWWVVCKEVFSIPIIKYCIIASMTSYGALMSFQGLWAVPFFMDVFRMEKSAASGLVTIIPLGVLSGILILGRFYDTKYGKLLYLLGSVSSLVVYLTLFLGMDKFIGDNFFKILFFIWGFCQGAGPYIFKIYSMILPKRHYGTALGIINMFPLIGCALYQSITGLLFDLFGGGTKVLHRSVGSYKLYFLFLTLSMVITILSVLKIIKTLNQDYQGKI